MKNSKIELIVCFIIMILVFGLFAFEVGVGKKSFQVEKITYSKDSRLNYLTYLKDNNHYDKEYIQNGYNLVANLIDYFNFDYTYVYTLGEKVNYELNYNIEAVLEIYDGDNDTKPIEKKNYKILEDKTLTGNSQVIKVDIHNQKVIYDTYNSVIQAWKREISPNANLKIYFNVDWTGYSNTLEKVIGDQVVTEFNVPISQKTIDIKNPAIIEESGVLTGKSEINKGYLVLVFSTLLLLITDLTYIIYLVRLNRQGMSKYDLMITKTLREFDRAITEVKGKFVKSKDYIEVKDFMELLDVHDNIGEPIMHYENDKNTNVFVIRNSNATYYVMLRRKDFE